MERIPALSMTTMVGCANACAYCPQRKFIKAYTARSEILRLSLETFERCLEKVPSRVNIHFAGYSEPFANTDCVKMILLAYGKGHKLRVYTTLSGMHPSDVDVLESVPFEDFCVHLPSNPRLENIKVDQNYLNLLRRLCNSKIKSTFLYHGRALDADVATVISRARWAGVCTRGGNIEIQGRPLPRRRKGGIACRRLNYNVMLPNGEVLLCCMDWGMQHVLGNLLDVDYESLFTGEEFQRVMRGFKDESVESLCRYCDSFAYQVGRFSEFLYRFRYKLDNVAAATLKNWSNK